MRKQTYIRRQKKRINIKPLLLGLGILVIILGLVLGGKWAFKKFTEPTKEIVEIEMGESVLPTVSVEEEGYLVNTLLPYVEEMDILTMRDTISPLTPQGDLTLQVNIKADETDSMSVDGIAYQVVSIDGENILKEESVSIEESGKVTLNLRSVLASGEEGVLKIVSEVKINKDTKKLFYYTRVTPYDECHLKQNLDFVQSVHTAVLEKDKEFLAPYFKNVYAKETGYYDQITDQSHVTDVMWGEHEPQIIGELAWSIKESSSLFTSIQLQYSMSMTQEGATEQYLVSEFFRVGYRTQIQGTQLRQYNRTIELVTTEEQIVDKLAQPSETYEWDDYKENKENTAVAFVAGQGMYLYDIENQKLINIYNSMKNVNMEDAFIKYHNLYDMKILSVDANQNVTFILYGYMSRGRLEGVVGTQVLYYDKGFNTVEEKAFIKSNHSYAVGKTEMSSGVYYSNIQNKIYAMVQNSLYEVDMNENVQHKLASNIQENGYTTSADGKYIGYIRNENIDISCCEVLDYETGKSYQIHQESNEVMYPLGFLERDFLVGFARKTDALVDETGTQITPMYKMEIRDSGGKVVKTFEKEAQYIRDIVVEDNMVTMNLLEKTDIEYLYAGQDVITNNEEVEAITAQGDVDPADIKTETAILIQNLDSIQIAYDTSSRSNMYYAYAYGDLQVMSAMPSKAIQYASEHMGMVVNEHQEYVWRSGSRDLRYMSTNVAEYANRLSSGESAIEIVAGLANQQVVSYTGCTVEQMCYLMNQRQMIAGKLQDDSWILLVGYNGATMTYLDSYGSKYTIEMYKLEEKIEELIGDGIF